MIIITQSISRVPMELFQKSDYKMSRSNPYKRKHRKANKTALIYGEGLNEEIFLKYLKSLYAHNSGIFIKIRRGKGGDPISLVVDTIKEPGDFGLRVLVLDNDRGKNIMSKALLKAEKAGIKVVQNTPCLEATLLSILKPSQNFMEKTSPWCKRKFENDYITGNNRADLLEYRRIFPEKMLEAQRASIPCLNTLISYIENL
jgi:hypothetical protein